MRAFLLSILGCLVLLAGPRAQGPAGGAAPAAPATRSLTGRIEEHAGLRVLHLSGSPAERGYAHGFLVGRQIAAVAIAEFTARFARQRPLLQQIRQALPRLIDYPADVRAEIEAVFAGMVDAGADLQMPELERDFDLSDLLLANALDVFGLLGCSGFTVWDDEVEGGGVLTARNFDWPLTGPHLLDATLLVVHHEPGGGAVAAVTWPGYLGVVTGINRDGLAAFLHVGSAQVTFTPEPGAWPSALALRRLLEQGRAADGAAAFDRAKDLLANTSPPAGYLTHLVLPRSLAGAGPAAVFETDSGSSVRAELPPGACVLTNHFRTRADGRPASKDSLDRERRILAGLERRLAADDRRVSIDEAWEVLASVQRGGSHAFGTLHALVFRHEPWHFELRVGVRDGDGKVVAAPQSPRRHRLDRSAVFGEPAAAK
ncbi:MAG: hypothetical protein KF830_17130 [Planctomycetes bacterium]|nr:hypothetical protein [Planctomycetota bacterium]